MSRTGKFFVVMRIDLHNDPAVIQMASTLKCRPEVIVGYLHRVWGWFATQTDDGRAFGVSRQAIADSLNLHEIMQLMEHYGWLEDYKDDNGTPICIIPNWDRWFSGAEKRKEYERERKRGWRKRGEKANVPDNVPDNSGTSSATAAPVLRPQEQEQEQEQEQLKSADSVGSASERDTRSREIEFLKLWNAADGVVRNRGDKLTAKRRTAFKARLKSAGWAKDAAEAIAKFPLACSSGDKAWKPDLDWFLRPDSVLAILEGKYDWSKEVRTGKPQSEAEAAQRRDDDRHREKHRRAIAKRKAEREERELNEAKRTQLGNLR